MRCVVFDVGGRKNKLQINARALSLGIVERRCRPLLYRVVGYSLSSSSSRLDGADGRREGLDGAMKEESSKRGWLGDGRRVLLMSCLL